MKPVFEITDRKIIDGVLEQAEYGTLALFDGAPYSVPVNFVYHDGAVYFHGAKKGRKASALTTNPRVSMSIVESFSLIPSYFSSNEGLACPATHFFKSVIIEGEASFVEETAEKGRVMQALMEKLQPEGKYRDFSDPAYETMLGATGVIRIDIKEIRAKFKFGQHLSEERFEMIIEHLESRGDERDLGTMKMMKKIYNKCRNNN